MVYFNKEMTMRKHFNVDLSEFWIQNQWYNALQNTSFVNKMHNLSHSSFDDLKNSTEEDGSILNYTFAAASVLRRGFRIKRRYQKEMKLFGKCADAVRQIFIGNMTYELYKAGDAIANFEWCSSLSKNTPDGPILARNMDWPLDGLDDCTISVDFEGAPAGEFTAITFPGFSGVLTGIAPERFSASINMMIEDYGFDIRDTPVAFLLREVFEECVDYDAAVDFLMQSDVFAPAFIHLVGTKPDEQCVIGMMTRKYENILYKVKKRDPGLIITNHIPDSDFDDDEYEVDSVERYRIAKRSLRGIKTLEKAFDVMQKDPLLNEETKYSVAMCANTGEYILN